MVAFGQVSTLPNTDNGNRKLIHACRFQTPSDSGYLLYLGIWMIGAASDRHAQMAIYSDNNGTPDALLLQTGGVTVTTDDWCWFPNLSLALTGGAYYWLAFVTDSDALIQQYGVGTTNQHCWASLGEGETYYGNIPSVFPPGIFGDGVYRMYGEYEPIISPPAESYAFDYSVVNSDKFYSNPITLVVNQNLGTVTIGTAGVFRTYIGSGVTFQSVYTKGAGTVTYNLVIGSAAHGSTSPLAGTYAYALGENVTVTGYPDSGYYLDFWDWNGVHVPNNGDVFAFSMGSLSNTITPHFEVEPTSPTWQIKFWDSVANWVTIEDAEVEYITEELNGTEEAVFKIPNTAANRSALHLDSLTPEASFPYDNVIVQIIYKSNVVFTGLCTGAEYSPAFLRCLLYNPTFTFLKQAPATVTASYVNVGANYILSYIIAASGLTSYVTQDWDRCSATPATINFKKTNAYDAVAALAKCVGLHFWGTGVYGTSGSYPCITVGTRDATIHALPSRIENFSRGIDRSKKYATVVIQSTDIETGTTIQGSATSGTGATKVYAYSKASDIATLNMLAAAKLAVLNNSSTNITITCLTEDVSTLHPGQYVTVNRADLLLNGNYIIQNIKKGPVLTTIDLEIPPLQEDIYLSELDGLVQDVIKNQ